MRVELQIYKYILSLIIFDNSVFSHKLSCIRTLFSLAFRKEAVNKHNAYYYKDVLSINLTRVKKCYIFKINKFKKMFGKDWRQDNEV